MNKVLGLEALAGIKEWVNSKDTALKTELQAQIGSPLVAATVSAMTDQTKVYVYTGSETGYTAGNWYYYNGSAWTSGGVYNSTAFETDPTLTIEGMAADAKATGDEITHVKEDINECNIQIDHNAGNTERIISELFTPISKTFTQATPYYWNTEGTQAVKTNLAGSAWHASDPISVSPGDIYTIKACQGNTRRTRIWSVTDDNYNIISTARDYYGLDFHEDTITIPQGGTKLLLTTTASVSGGTYPYMYLWAYITAIKTDTYKQVPVALAMNITHYWNIENNVAVYTELLNSNWQASDPINVSEGEFYTIKACQGSTHKTRIWVITDDSLNIISMADDYFGANNIVEQTFIIPSGGTKLLVTNTTTGLLTPTLLHAVSAIDLTVNRLKGKKLSLLGDSISAYTGTIPMDNTPYYTGSNSGVSSPDQMWWHILCDYTGMIPLVINGWSGSGINWQTDSSHADIVPMSDDSRCNGLHDGSTTPDIILIAGGVNDYTYAQYAQNEPLAWDGKSVPEYTEPSAGKKVYNSFTDAYVAMIKKIQTNYPNAIVVALSTWFTMRGTDNGYVLTHTVGQNTYTQQNYNDAIRYVAEQMHIPYIDVSNIGFNRNNFYPNYAVDSSTIPTHPNAAGHAVMGKAIAEKIIVLVGGYLN